jgi:hypothetical protein
MFKCLWMLVQFNACMTLVAWAIKVSISAVLMAMGKKGVVERMWFTDEGKEDEKKDDDDEAKTLPQHEKS